MGMRINTNTQSLNTQRALRNTKQEQTSSIEKLSSGERINMAADDAAGLAISERLKSEVKSSEQAYRNAGDGVSILQTTEGALSEASNILTRLRELSIQSSTDTVSEEDRSYTNMEFQSLVSEVDRIAKSTTFNGKALADGTAEEYTLQVGTKADPESSSLVIDLSEMNSTSDGLELSGVDISTKDGALEALSNVDGALTKLNGSRAQLGAMQNRLKSTMTNLDQRVTNIKEANSRIRDTDIAAETAKLAQANIKSASGISVLSQANSAPNGALRLLG